ncbi:MAG: electron transport complex subunit RsxC, partial [Cellvibrio sp.]
EAEKEAKRIARKKAAEEVKLQLAEQKIAAIATDPSPKISTPNVDLVTTAVVKVDAPPLNQDDQKARLERILAAARNSLDSARAPLVPKNREFPVTDEQLIKQQSRIKQAELKLAEAEKKLADFLLVANQATANAIAIESAVESSPSHAQAKQSQSQEEKLRASIETMKARLSKAIEKAEQAKNENNPSASVLQIAAEKMKQKIAETQAELDILLSESNKVDKS